MVVVVYLDYSVSSGPFLKFSMRFEFLSEILYYSVCEICEIRDPSLTIKYLFIIYQGSGQCGQPQIKIELCNDTDHMDPEHLSISYECLVIESSLDMKSQIIFSLYKKITFYTIIL